MSTTTPGNRTNRSIYSFVAIALGIFFTLPLVLNQPYFIRVMINIFFFAALGSAWNIIGGFGGQLSLGHAAFVALGAYPTAL
ncbi:MAG: hypothetical protein P8X90_34260, partial [Desulfobacterales bacterium]